MLSLASAPPAQAFPGETLPVSVGLPGYGPISSALTPAVSDDGRYVAYTSSAPQIVLGENNGHEDIFVWDRETNTTVLASKSTSGEPANGGSTVPAISADGRYIAFSSSASNLVPGDVNGVTDIFVRDVAMGTTTLVSKALSGMQANGSSGNSSISADGRFVTFSSNASNLVLDDTNSRLDSFVRDLVLGVTIRVSLSSTGVQATGDCGQPSIAANGTCVVFTSLANNLVPDDSNQTYDVFVRDIQSGSTSRANVSTAGVQANLTSQYAFSKPRLSSDGRYVAFWSSASNLVSDDTNGTSDIFVRDRLLGTTTRASVDATGGQANGGSTYFAISANGRFVTFSSFASNLVFEDLNGKSDIFVHDLQDGGTFRTSISNSGNESNGSSRSPSISADGRIVALGSAADNLVPSDLNSIEDVFVRDRLLQATARVTSDTAAVQGNNRSSYASISQNGRFVSFYSEATNLVPGGIGYDIFLRDLVLGTTTRVSVNGQGSSGSNASYNPSVSGDGRYVVFQSWATNLVAGDTNDYEDIFLHDAVLGTTTRVSVDSAAAQANGDSYFPIISSDARYVCFYSNATNLSAENEPGLFVRDLYLGKTTCVPGSSGPQSISADGRYLVFSSGADNLVPGDTNGVSDIFVRDLRSNLTRRISVDSQGAQGNRDSYYACISGDGRYVAFDSNASNLVAGDTNGQSDVFVRDLTLETTFGVSYDLAGQMAGGSYAAISADGRRVVFHSDASNLIPGDTNGKRDLFVHELLTGMKSKVGEVADGGYGPDKPSISSSGQFVAFDSYSALSSFGKLSGIQDVFRHELVPGGSVIEGKVTLRDYKSFLPNPLIMFELVPTSGGAPVSIPFIAIGEDGSYSFVTPETGTYTLYARASTFLRAKFPTPITLTGAAMSGINLDLINGDCDGDNTVTMFDYVLLTAAFDTTVGTSTFDPRADLDGDGVVSLFDYLILSDNLDREGD